MRLDHLAIAATSLDEGVAWAEDRLGVPLLPGGQHVRFGTHNRLLGLTDGLYLEVIAPDPSLTPDRPRWFGLDHFKGAPRLGNWICAVDNLPHALKEAPPMDIVPMQRSDLRWDMAVPEDGSLPLAAGFPTLLQWHSPTPPGQSLPPSGLSLDHLTIAHPLAPMLSDLLSPQLADDRIRFVTASMPGLSATLTGPNGTITL